MKPAVRITLEDGSHCYVTHIPVASFHPSDVARAAGEAMAWFITSFQRDFDDRGDVWDPEKWLAEQQQKRLALRG